MASAKVPEELPACSISEVESSGRKRVTVNGRDIFIVKLRNTFYALDSFCYHAGGPLYNSDIEEVGGRSCLVCPWHGYKVCVDNGENIYQSIDPYNLEKPPQWKTAGVRQRTHRVDVRNGNIYVTLSSPEITFDSDHYNNKDGTPSGL